tara:strand:+ start:261 stop:467 length:207 start_codon:yes stop_codon:yes gene_type:complete
MTAAASDTQITNTLLPAFLIPVDETEKQAFKDHHDGSIGVRLAKISVLTNRNTFLTDQHESLCGPAKT